MQSWYRTGTVKKLLLSNRNLVAIGIFFFSVLLLTRLDFLINNILYNFGLTFSEAWYQEYGILYFLAYQLIVFTLLAYTKNLKLFAFFQVFVLTSTQDLVYFGLWEGSFPSHEWVWMVYYRIFGFWNTTSQILLSLSSLSSIMILSRVDRIQVWIQASSIAKYLSRKM
jgi:hypothetical protein